MAEYTLDTSLARETAASLDAFTLSYVEALFWLLTDDNGNSLDYLGLHDLAPDALDAIKADCAAFQADHAERIAGRESEAGHDFYLTRNGHGAGFWDGDWPEPDATILTDASRPYSGADAYVGDDGFVYV
jgi:hypothetical protein